MKQIVAAFLLGLVFGAGLVISGMSNPAKVIGFLDITGEWDPSLALVMGGAVIVFGVSYRLTPRNRRPLLARDFSVLDRKDLDTPLLIGALVFGIGWGLSGFCPGPAFTALPLLAPGTLIFLPAMLAGLWLGARIKAGGSLQGKGATS